MKKKVEVFKIIYHNHILNKISSIFLLMMIGIIFLTLITDDFESYAQENNPQLKIKEWDVPTPNSFPHEIIVDNNGIVWFAEKEGNNIGKFDPQTEEFTEYKIPTQSSKTPGVEADDSGNIWFTERKGHKIGKLNTITGEISEYLPITPTGPHTPVFGNGILWFTLYDVGKIGSFDPQTEEMKEYDTSSESTGAYGITVDKYDNVWFSMTSIYKIGKFDQRTNTIHEYDLPTPNTIIRFMSADNEGNVWYANNNNNKIGVVLLDSSSIPDWIKSNAGWWAEGTIDDDSFIQGIQFLIKEGIVKIQS